MSTTVYARQRFRYLISQPEAQLALAESALCIAWEDQGQGDPSASLRQLDAIADGGRATLIGLNDPSTIVAALNSYLFETLGFHGNTHNYYAANNSFLDRVLETRTGLPITLTLIYLEVGWRLGLPIYGIALPGHFLAAFSTRNEEIFIDPFNRGRIWSRDECEQQIIKMYGSTTASTVQTFLTPASRRSILVRMLRNLKHTYLSSGDLPHALTASERILLLLPHHAEEVRDCGLLRARLGQTHRALEDLEHYTTLAPTADDLPEIEKYARLLAEQLAYGN